MTEVLFILTTVFVAYVVYVIVNEPKPSVRKAAQPEPQKAEPAQNQPEAIVKPVTPEKKTHVSKKAATPRKTGLKDPKTGEIATVYSNYRFTKRWIKDALVAEGLLDKVYKNNELDVDTEIKIKQAVAKLEEIEKYRA